MTTTMTVLHVGVGQGFRPAATPCERVTPSADWFAAPDTIPAATAAQLCHYCPVRELCLVGAIERNEPWGVWGGQQFPLCRNGHDSSARNVAHRPTATNPDRTICRACETDARRRRRASVSP